MIKSRSDDPQRVVRQQVFLRALRTLPDLSSHFGSYQETAVWRPLARPPARGSRFVEVLRSEEKGSDVDLATQLLMDTYEGSCEQAAVISNDSDLARPIEVAASKLRHGVIVFNPHPGTTARRLQKAATEYRSISERSLRRPSSPRSCATTEARFTSRQVGSARQSRDSRPRIRADSNPSQAEREGSRHAPGRRLRTACTSGKTAWRSGAGVEPTQRGAATPHRF